MVERNALTQSGISVIVITRNRRDDVTRCVRSLLASTYPEVDVIVIDNASEDGTSEHLMTQFPNIVVIVSPINLLPAAAVNLGAANSSGGYILAMADDNVVDRDMLTELVAAARSTGAGIVGAKNFFMQDPERIWSFGSEFNLTTGICSNPHTGELDRGQCSELWEPDSVQNVLLISRRAFNLLGGFDAANFPIHNEEADLCFRARMLGIGVVSAPKARVWHDVPLAGEALKLGARDFTVDSPLRAYYTARNRALLVRKYGRRWQWCVFAAVFHPLASLVYGVVMLSKRNRWALMWAYLRGTAAAYSGRC